MFANAIVVISAISDWRESGRVYRLSCQQDHAGTGFHEVSLWMFQKRFLAGSKQIVRRFASGINRQMPLSPVRYVGQMKINRIGAGIEHEIQGTFLIFMDQTGKVLFFRAGPVR